jgi:zinc transport system substrate-binding protein
MRTVLTLALTLSLAVAAAGCADDGDGGTADGRTTVVAAFFPLAEAARLVGGDAVDVVDLTPSGVEPHDLELSSDDVDALLDADVVIVLGGGFQPAVEDVAEDRDGTTVTIEPAGDDPHVWLDPRQFAGIVEEVADALDVDAGAVVAELDALHERFDRTLSSCARDLLVVQHEAFGSLADAYGLRQEGITGLVPGEEPDPARLDALVRLVEDEGVTTVFAEPLLPARVAETLAREAGVEVATLNPLESAPADGAGYVEAMEANLDALAAGLAC